MEEDNGIKLRCIPLDVLGGHENLKKLKTLHKWLYRLQRGCVVGWGGEGSLICFSSEFEGNCIEGNDVKRCPLINVHERHTSKPSFKKVKIQTVQNKPEFPRPRLIKL